MEVINQKRVRVFDRGIQTPRNRWNLEEDERIISLCVWLLHLYDLRIDEGATDQILLLCAFNRSDVAVKKKSSVPCGDIFVASFANRQNYWHSRAAKHLKRPCLHRNLCWDFCQTFSLRNLILVDCRSEIKMGSPCLLLRYDGCEYLHQSICCQFTPSLLTIVS